MCVARVYFGLCAHYGFLRLNDTQIQYIIVFINLVQMSEPCQKAVSIWVDL